jgi:zinc-binding alcohol dehydrogenase/oxidoreductase
VRAVELRAGALEVVELPDPEPGPGQALVDVRFAALNHRDRWIMLDPPSDPVVLGSDAAGTVAAVGAGVTAFRPGDEVVIDAALDWGEGEDAPGPEFRILGKPDQGTYAERIVVAAHQLRTRPARLTWEESAALPLAGLTAWRALRLAGAGPGRQILVPGAGGGVGTFVVQIGAALGARMIATVGTEGKGDALLALGAERAVGYRDPAWPDRVGEVDAIVDSVGGPVWDVAHRVLRRGGVLVSFGDTAGDTGHVPIADLFLEWRRMVGTTMGSPREFDAMLAHAEAAAWRPVVDSVFPLERAAEAHARLIEPDRFGKVVLAIR